MKKTRSIFTLVLLISTLFISCQSDTKKLASSDDIGTYAFGVLNSLHTISETAYIQKLYTFEEMNAYVKAHPYEFEKEFLDNYSVVTKANFNTRLSKDYQKLKKEGENLGIDWNAIESIEFKYWPREKYGVKAMKGDLFFGYNKKAYKITVTAFEANDGYFVTKIENLQKVIFDKKE